MSAPMSTVLPPLPAAPVLPTNSPAVQHPPERPVLEGTVMPVGDPDAAVMTRGEAEAITEHIRNAIDMTWALIARAHAGRAWQALGYDSWASYTSEQFGVSRSRSYQLINQAEVITAISAAAPEGTVVKISERAARDLRKVIDEVVPAVARETEGLTPESAEARIGEILDSYRSASEPAPSNAGAVAEFMADAGYDDGDRAQSASGGGSDSAGFDSANSVEWNPAPPLPPLTAAQPGSGAGGDTDLRERMYDLRQSLVFLSELDGPHPGALADAVPPEFREAITQDLLRAVPALLEFTRVWAQRPWNDADVTEALESAVSPDVL